MTTLASETVPLHSQEDIVAVRQRARCYSVECGLGLTDQTKLVTAASELARNTVIHGGGGTAVLERVERQGLEGVRITFEDHGPGIPDMQLAMRSGYSSGEGLGLGLPGSKRLVHEFEIVSEPGQGTRATIVRWK